MAENAFDDVHAHWQDVDIFRERKANPHGYCPDALEFYQFCNTTIENAISRGTVQDFRAAQYEIAANWRIRWRDAGRDHRTISGHPCVFQVYLTAWDDLQRRITNFIPELQPRQESIQEQHREPPAIDLRGSILGEVG